MTDALRRYETISRIAATDWANSHPLAMGCAYRAATDRLTVARHAAELSGSPAGLLQLLADRADDCAVQAERWYRRG